MYVNIHNTEIWDNLFRGSHLYLEKYILHKFVLTNIMMYNKDNSYQIIFPMCDTNNYVINNVTSKLFYGDVETFNNFYALSVGIVVLYGHKFINVI